MIEKTQSPLYFHGVRVIVDLIWFGLVSVLVEQYIVFENSHVLQIAPYWK